MRHFFIIGNPSKDGAIKMSAMIKTYLEDAGCSCNLQEGRHEDTNEGVYTDAAKVPAKTECIVVLGGDGTLIEAARDTINLRIPLIGMNLGMLGFLAEVEVANWKSALEALIHDQYKIENRMMIKGCVFRNEECLEKSYALNDIVITRNGSMQIINFSIYVNGQFLNTYSADGVIVSTPTGSTGYNMSAGGPIVEPKAKLMVITPVCPHTLNTRSVVLSADDEIIIQMETGKGNRVQNAEVDFDGGHSHLLSPGDKIVITRSSKTTDIVKLNQVSFLEVLHKKMSEK